MNITGDRYTSDYSVTNCECSTVNNFNELKCYLFEHGIF